MSEEKQHGNIETFRKLEAHIPELFKSIETKNFIIRLSQYDRRLYNIYFKGYRINRFKREKLVEICKREMFERENDDIAVFVNMLWNQEHKKVYNVIFEEVSKINEDVESIEEITDEQGDEILKVLLEKDFPPRHIYYSLMLNEVRVSEEFIKTRLLPLIG